MFAQNQQNSLPTTGNVGVGTTSPDVKLQVNGRMQVDSSLVVKDSAVFEKRAHIKNRIVVDEDAIIKGKLVARDKLKVKGTAKFEGKVKMLNLNTVNNNDTTLLFVNHNGKVKKGTIAQLLDVIGQNPENVGTLTKLMYSEPCILVPEGGVNTKSVTPQNYVPVWANKVGVLWTGLPCPAKVGIGTDNPLATLHVEGNSYFRDNVGIKTLPQSGTNLSIQTATSIGSASNVYGIKITTVNDENKAIALMNASLNKEMFTLFGDGSFQFSNATQKILQLDVNGTLYSRRVVVNLDVWPDFVFEKNYTLPTLKATEQYIKQNGHLPNVPSAEEVTKNGLDVGEMNKILLQKVEELTLHLIAQEKAIQHQAQRIDELEKILKIKKTTKP